MNFKWILLISFFVIIASCNTNQKPTDQESTKEKSDNFSIHLVGTIDTLNIDMFLFAKDRMIRGYYQYQKYNTPISLLGYIDEKTDSIFLLEYQLIEDSNEIALDVTATFQMSQSYIGKWEGYPTILDISLKATNKVEPDAIYEYEGFYMHGLYEVCGMHCCSYIELLIPDSVIEVTRFHDCIDYEEKKVESKETTNYVSETYSFFMQHPTLHLSDSNVTVSIFLEQDFLIVFDYPYSEIYQKIVDRDKLIYFDGR